MLELLKQLKENEASASFHLKHGESFRGQVVEVNVNNGKVIIMINSPSHAPEKIHFLMEQIGSVRT